MKYIRKKQEPESLRELRETEGATYDGPWQDWQKALLVEQGHLCAYCMARISLDRSNEKGTKPKMEIEHYLPRETYPDSQFDWRNMIAVCNGKSGLKPHCDKAEGGNNTSNYFVKGKKHGDVILLKLNPLSLDTSENIIIYSLSGEIKAIAQNPDVEDDLNLRLNLNDSKLIQFRKGQIDMAKELLEKKYPDRRWGQRDFDKEIENWLASSEGKLKPYHMAAIWFLKWLKQQPKYK
jgi:uncharacterized protein (TIGR02646 family)